MTQARILTRQTMLTSRALAARVRRYHTWPVLHTQTVGEHSARVGTIYVEIFGLPRAEVLYYILHHDSGELHAGDLPYPIKVKYPALRESYEQAETEGFYRLKVYLPELAPHEERRIKIADLAEMHEFGVVEYNMGNKYAEPIVRDTWKAVHDLARDTLDHDAGQLTVKWMSENGWEMT